jgi:hypothetical protein
LRSLRINISILLLLPIGLLAQEKDSVRNKFLPTGIRVSTDALALVRNTYDETFKGWEVNADVDFYRYYLTVDYGSWGRTYIQDSSNYSNNGNYFRIGADVNFLTKNPDKNMFFLGIRYAHSSFSEDYSVIVNDPLWGTSNEVFQNRKVPANWFELTSGLRVRIWKAFWMGYTIRYKFALKMGDTPDLLPHDVPGYGLTNKNIYWGFNYQLLFRIPITKRQLQSAPVKK